MNKINNNKRNNIPKPILVSNEQYAKCSAYQRSGDIDTQDIIDAIDNYSKKRNLEKDEFDKKQL